MEPRQLSPEKRKALMARIEELKVWKLTERLNLTEAQSVKFFPKYKAYQEKSAEHFEQMHEQMQALRVMQEGKASESEIDAKIDEFLKTQAAMPELLHHHIKEFREVLSARQVAELIIFERDFMRDLKGILRKANRRGGRFNSNDDD
ncbi:Spy/CpxP family protein refolding chaperone [Chloroherpeton thalassium]|nr:Spy/CpxP family protein refolding chaperone [Chloroherpeton thalassium]